MTLTININATCETCSRQGLSNYCGPCKLKIGRRLWHELPGIECEVIDSWHDGQKFPDRVRRIKAVAGC